VVGHEQLDLLAVDRSAEVGDRHLDRFDAARTVDAEYSPEMSVMNPMRITSPEYCASAGGATSAAVIAHALATRVLWICFMFPASIA